MRKPSSSEKIQQHILRRSQEDQQVDRAIREWRFTGSFKDHQAPNALCELCGNTGLRYHFQIVNQITGEALWVGSQCILNFDLSKTRIRRAKKNHIQSELEAARFTRLIPPIQKLYEQVGKADRRKIHWAVGKFERRGGFSPKELAWLFQAMMLLQISFPAEEYPLTLRSKQDRQEYSLLPITTRNLIDKCLTVDQRRKLKAE
jgi:hypothetical protein